MAQAEAGRTSPDLAERESPATLIGALGCTGPGIIISRITLGLAVWLIPQVWALEFLPAADAPRLALEPRRLDFGSCGHHERPSATITIRNDGGAPLVITEIEPSCSCLDIAPLRPMPIAPGTSLKLQISMGSGRAMGRLDKHVTLRTNDPKAATLQIPVTMRVLEEFQMAPLQIQFNGAHRGQPLSSEVEISRRRGFGDRPFALEVKRVEAQFGLPSARFLEAKALDSPKGKRISVRLDPAHPEGRIAAEVHAILDGRAFVLPITGEMFAWILLDTRFVNFSAARPEAPDTLVRELRLSSIDGTPFAIIGVTQEPLDKAETARLGFEIASAPSNQSHRLVVKLTPGKTTPGMPTFHGRIRVRTDHPQKPELVLNYSGFFKP